MRRKRALLLFGSLGVLTLGYVAWCGRMFYLSPSLPGLQEIPGEYREDARGLLIRHGFAAPEPFDFRLLGRLLCHPYHGKPDEVSAFFDYRSPDILVVMRCYRNTTDTGRIAFFAPQSGGVHTWVHQSSPSRDPVETRLLASSISPAPATP